MVLRVVNRERTVEIYFPTTSKRRWMNGKVVYDEKKDRNVFIPHGTKDSYELSGFLGGDLKFADACTMLTVFDQGNYAWPISANEAFLMTDEGKTYQRLT